MSHRTNLATPIQNALRQVLEQDANTLASETGFVQRQLHRTPHTILYPHQLIGIVVMQHHTLIMEVFYRRQPPPIVNAWNWLKYPPLCDRRTNSYRPPTKRNCE
jgi:hypothetical protein